MNKPQRVAIIGFDCPLVPQIKRYIADGHLPNFKRIFDSGVVADNCLVPFPTITPPNWTTIATGTAIGTHQVVDFWVPVLGKTPDSNNTIQSFSSERGKSEFLWDTLDKAGKKCVVLNYPGSWPSHMQNGIIIGGAGLGPWDNMDGRRETGAVSVCVEQMITNGHYPSAIRGKFVPASDWQNLDNPGEEPLEMQAQLNFPKAAGKPVPTTWWVLAQQSNEDGYDTITLSPTKDMANAFCTLRKVGDWSKKIFTTIRMVDGTERTVFFKVKLVELSEDAEDFRLFITCLADVEGRSAPPDAIKRVISPDFVPVTWSGYLDAKLGMIDWDTWAECANEHTQWLADAAVSLLKDGDWDLFAMHSHSTDHGYHLFLSELEPMTSKNRRTHEEARKTDLKMYQSQDRLLGRILDAIPPDTLVLLVSDHGAVADGPVFDPYKALAQAGLALVLEEVKASDPVLANRANYGQLPAKVDYSQTKALPQSTCYVNVHLKGRDPEGIVDPTDYATVQQQIIDALYTYVDPETGKRPVALALTKQDARLLGLYGEAVADVVYAVYPWFGGQHGSILPTVEWGIGSLKGLLVFNGSGIKQGVKLERTVGLQDIVPTICYLMDWPIPPTVDGAVIYQVFQDPNFKLVETRELNEELEKAEAMLSGSQPA